MPAIDARPPYLDASSDKFLPPLLSLCSVTFKSAEDVYEFCSGLQQPGGNTYSFKSGMEFSLKKLREAIDNRSGPLVVARACLSLCFEVERNLSQDTITQYALELKI